MTRSELVAKLKRIAGLYDTTQEIKHEINTYKPDDCYERNVSVPKFPGDLPEEHRCIWAEKLDHTISEAPSIAEQSHRKLYAPQKPQKPVRKEFQEIHNIDLENKQKKFKGLFVLAAVVCAFFLLGAVVGVDESSQDTLPTILGIAAVAGAAAAFCKYKQMDAEKALKKMNEEARIAHERQQDEIMAEYERNMKAYEGQSAKYEQDLQKFMGDYHKWREIYIQSAEEEAEIAEKLEADRKAAVEKIYKERYVPALAALNEENDMVSESYLPVLDDIIDLIASNRADGLKEAINLYEDLVYRERQLQLQREQEEQRRYEEAQKRADEERRYQEEMQFRKDQERQRQREAAAQKEAEERRHKEEMAQRERQEWQRRNEENEQRRKESLKRADEERRQKELASKQCRFCAHVGKCSMAYRNSTPNCTGFTPR